MQHMNNSLLSTERSYDTSDYNSDDYSRLEEEKEAVLNIVRESIYQSTNLITNNVNSVADITIT
jgi:hypothetical protein